MPKPDLKDLSTELSFRVCKHILGEDNEQCKLLYTKAKNKEMPVSDYMDEMQKLIEATETPMEIQGETKDARLERPQEASGEVPNQTM